MLLSGPARVAAHPTADVVGLADTGNGRVIVARPAGTVLGVVEGLARPHGLRFTTTGVLIAEAGAGRVVHVALDGSWQPDQVSVVVDALPAPTDCVLAPDGTVTVAAAGGPTIVAARPDGTTQVVAGRPGKAAHVDGPAGASRLIGPVGLGQGAQGTFVVDRDAHALRILTPTGLLATLIGRGPEQPGFADGPVATAAFRLPSGVASAPDGASAYVADTGNDALRLWSGVDGEVQTLPLPAGELSAPSDVDLLPDGRLLVADTGHDRVVIVDLAAGTVVPLALV